MRLKELEVRLRKNDLDRLERLEERRRVILGRKYQEKRVVHQLELYSRRVADWIACFDDAELTAAEGEKR